MLTIVIGYGASFLPFSVVSTAALSGITLFAIAMGAIASAIATAKVNTGNLIMDGFVGAIVATVITAILYGAFNLDFSAVLGFVFIGNLGATIISKKYHK